MLKTKNVAINAIVNAGATATYILAVASFLTKVEKIFPQTAHEDSILIPVVMLLLFVVSATITAFLVLGKPIMWYADGDKKEAIQLLIFTIVSLTVLLLFFLSIIAL